jgi:hypothetical protein
MYCALPTPLPPPPLLLMAGHDQPALLLLLLLLLLALPLLLLLLLLVLRCDHSAVSQHPTGSPRPWLTCVLSGSCCPAAADPPS